MISSLLPLRSQASLQIKFNRLPVAVFVSAYLVAGCSASSDDEPVGAPATLPSTEAASNDVQASANVVAPSVLESGNGNDSSNASPSNATTTEIVVSGESTNDVVTNTEVSNENNDALNDAAQSPVVTDSNVQTRTLVTFDITVPAYQSNELLVEVRWGDMKLAAGWVGDEYWSVSSDVPADTEQLLTVSFYDRNGGIELAQYSDTYRTGSNGAETVAISADQLNAAQFDEDQDGISNLDELLSGRDPSIDEDALLEIVDAYTISSFSSSRMSVSTTFEGRVLDERPYSDSFERMPVPNGYPGTLTSDLNIDVSGNGTYAYDESIQGNIYQRDGIRTVSENAITWEGSRYSYDGDYGHRVSFNNTVTVEDSTTRTMVEELTGSNSGTYVFSWNVSTNITGRLVEGTSLCEPIAGNVASTYSANYRGSEGTTTTETTISKAIDDTYWRVVSVSSNGEIEEYFARALHIYRSINTRGSDETPPEEKYFTCEFVDI